MLKKIGFVFAGTTAGLAMLGGVATAEPTVIRDDGPDQVGLVNLNNTDILHNVNAVVGACDLTANVLGVQAVLHDLLNGNATPLLSPGGAAESEASDACATGAIQDGGSEQDS